MESLRASWVLVSASALLSLALLILVQAPSSGAAHLLSKALPIPDVAASDFDADLNAAAKAKPQLRSIDFAKAEKDADHELRDAPMKPDAWLRLAYARALSAGGFSLGSLAAFERSYAVAPIDAQIAPWRIHFGLERWGALSPSLRRLVTSELEELWVANPNDRDDLTSAVLSVANPGGRAAGEASLTNLGWTPKA